MMKMRFFLASMTFVWVLSVWSQNVNQQVNQNINVIINQQAPAQIIEVQRLPNIKYSSTFKGRLWSPKVLPFGQCVYIGRDPERPSAIYGDVVACIEESNGNPSAPFMQLPGLDKNKCEEEIQATHGMYFWQRGQYAVRIIIDKVYFDKEGRIEDWRGTLIITGP